MREVHVDDIRDTVARLCLEATCLLPDDVVGALQTARKTEKSPVAVQVLDQIILNATLLAMNAPLSGHRTPCLPRLARTCTSPEIPDRRHHAGVGRVPEGFLRASIVDRPFSARTNTKDNTPPVVHTEIVPGDQLRIQVMPKGGGCENMSRFTIMLPSAGKQGITDFVLQAIEEAGGNPCPPIIVGLGVGGTAEYAMYLAKRALTRKVGDPSPDPEAAAFEADLLEKVNALGVGPQAVGGTTTALAVHMETYPTHIASLPVAVNLQCHSARLKEAVL